MHATRQVGRAFRRLWRRLVLARSQLFKFKRRVSVRFPLRERLQGVNGGGKKTPKNNAPAFLLTATEMGTKCKHAKHQFPPGKSGGVKMGCQNTFKHALCVLVCLL